jgi:hypothetical protein
VEVEVVLAGLIVVEIFVEAMAVIVVLVIAAVLILIHPAPAVKSYFFR